MVRASDLYCYVLMDLGSIPPLSSFLIKSLHTVTQSHVFSIESYQTYVVATSWLMTMAEW